MNIFVLSNDPKYSAVAQCDKHVIKMPLESAQMIASALRRHGATDIDMPFTKSGTPYGNAHPHHPCTLWAGECHENFVWLCEHGLALCEEYTYRYGKVHACRSPIQQMFKRESYIPQGDMTDHVQAIPDKYKQIDPARAYRAYYQGEKSAIATWNKGREAPRWWVQR